MDFGEAVGVIGGVRQKLHFFCMDLPQSDACFAKAYPCETTEVFLDGHLAGFAFFGGVPLSILYDNLKIAVAKICSDGKCLRTRAFTELASHYLFADRFGRPGKGADKGKVEGLVKYARANFRRRSRRRRAWTRSTPCWLIAVAPGRAIVPDGMPKPLASVWRPIVRYAARCPRCRWSRARGAQAGCPRHPWSGIAAMTTRCRPSTGFGTWW